MKIIKKINPPINQPTNPPTHQSTNPPIHQPTNPQTNPRLAQPFLKVGMFGSTFPKGWNVWLNLKG